MAEQRRKVVFISGASSGIGNSCAAFLAKKGFIVYGTSRNPSKAQRKADEFFNLLPMDILDGESVRQAVASVLDKEGCIDLLLCNAGMGIAGPAEETPLEDAQRQMDTNFLGAVRLIQETLPAMRKAGRGMILVTSSIGGRIGLPFQAFYSASKFALEGFVDALRMEIKHFGVQAALIEPGDFRSGFTASRNKLATEEGGPYAELAAAALNKAEADENGGADPVAIARLVHKLALSERLKPRYTVGSFAQRLAVVLKDFLPDTLVERGVMSYYGMARRTPRR